jgi:prepilin-type N-terminal cleavage/methylation domain-containing protein
MIRPRRRLGPDNSGMTLLEVMISIGILSFAFVALSAALMFIYRSGHNRKYDMFGMEILISSLEEAKGYPFQSIGVNGADTGDLVHPDNRDYTVVSDSATGASAINYTVSLNVRGFGEVQSGSSTSLTVLDPGIDGVLSADMTPNEFVGHFLMIVGPSTSPRLGQRSQITANTTNQFTVSPAWGITPAAGDQFRVDDGKFIDASVTWTYRGRTRTETLRALVTPQGAEDSLNGA